MKYGAQCTQVDKECKKVSALCHSLNWYFTIRLFAPLYLYSS